MSYRDTLKRLSGQAEAQAVALYQMREAGQVDDDTFVAVLAAIVAAANSRAAALADLSLAAALTVALRRPVAPLGLTPSPDDPERLSKAASTLLAVETLTPQRVARLARAEPLDTAARSYSQGMAHSPHVTGWTRAVSADACQACQSMAGGTLPDTVPMWHHTGCTCSPIPVTN